MTPTRLQRFYSKSVVSAETLRNLQFVFTLSGLAGLKQSAAVHVVQHRDAGLSGCRQAVPVHGLARIAFRLRQPSQSGLRTDPAEWCLRAAKRPLECVSCTGVVFPLAADLRQRGPTAHRVNNVLDPEFAHPLGIINIFDAEIGGSKRRVCIAMIGGNSNGAVARATGEGRDYGCWSKGG